MPVYAPLLLYQANLVPCLWLWSRYWPAGFRRGGVQLLPSHIPWAGPRSRLVPSTSMQAIPVGFFLFLVELAAGGLVVTVALDWQGEVGPGFLLLNAVFLLGFALAGIWLRTVLPVTQLVEGAMSPWVALEPGVWALCACLLAAALVALKVERRTAARATGTLGALAGLGALGISAAAYAPAGRSLLLVLVSFWAAALALGSVWTAMMLGHWYLVTPRLAPRPLLRLIALLGGALAIQALLLAAEAAAGLSLAVIPWLFWLRTGVGIALPAVLAVLAWRTARVRSMMSATGLLYVALGAVLAGEIMAKALFFVTRTPV